MIRNSYKINGDVCEVYLSNFKQCRNPGELLCIIDTADLPKVEKHVWYMKSGRYAYNNAIGFMHNYLMNPEDGFEVDHINRNGLDNRRCNLDIVTHQENCRRRGMRVDNTSGTTGVSYVKPVNRWLAYTSIDNKRFNLGYYLNKEDAIYARQVYNKYRIKPSRKSVLNREYDLK